jgi:hypothetical protein
VDKGLATDGGTRLFVAAQNNDPQVVQALIDAGADVNKTEASGHTPLYEASQEGNLEIVLMLMAAAADVDLTGADGFTPLLTAAMCNRLEVTQALIAAGADINKADKDGFTPLFVAAGRNLEIVKVLIAASADLNRQGCGRSPFLVAAQSRSRRLEVVQALVAAGADLQVLPFGPPIRFAAPDSPTALYVAAHAGLLGYYPLLPPELTSEGADPDEEVRADPDEVLKFLRKAREDRAARRHELLVCIANARREQDAGRGGGLHPLLNKLAKLPPEVVREFVIPSGS